MKKTYLLFTTLIWLLTSCSSNKAPETELEAVSYSLGVTFGSTLKTQGVEELDINSLAKGFNDMLADNDLHISEDSSLQVIQNYLSALAEEKSAVSAEEEQAYLAENKEKDGVITTESGLQYEIISSGNSTTKPKATDTVTVHYHGTLTDGNIFDSSVERGEPISFPLNRVIQGWTEAVQLMSIGDKWKITIPSNLAYGERGEPRAGIGPNATLIFEVELLKIN